MNEFNVGDVVRVVSESNTDCPFIWVSSMDEYLGETVKVCKKEWSNIFRTYRYAIDKDNGCFAWCGNCFLPIEDEPAKDIDEVSFLSILTTGSDTA